MQRKLKVYEKYLQNSRRGVIVPQIRLQGVWLKQMGFKPGQTIQVTQNGNSITITLVY